MGVAFGTLPVLRKAAFSRRSAVFLGAVALHVLLAVLVASKVAPEMAEPPVMQVTLLQLPARTMPPPPRETPAARTPTATPSRSAPTGVAPPVKAAAPTTDWRVKPSEAQAEQARPGLRAQVGCRSADLLALTKAERAACDEALAKGVENAPTYAVISPKLKKVFDRTFECAKGDVWCEYRIGKAPYPGLMTPMKKKRDPSWDQ